MQIKTHARDMIKVCQYRKKLEVLFERAKPEISLNERLKSMTSLYSITTQQIFTCSKSSIETLEKGVKYVQG